MNVSDTFIRGFLALRCSLRFLLFLAQALDLGLALELTFRMVCQTSMGYLV